MSWISATGRGLLIVAFFFVATVWLPDFLLGLDGVASAPWLVRDLVVLGAWSTGFVGGICALRLSQQRGLI